MAKSQNGYSANDVNQTQVWRIPGTVRDVRLRKGDAGYLLTHLAAWFDKHVEDIEAGQLDDWGYASRTIRGSSTDLSNHASGTAIDLNATKHPLGKRNTFTAQQAAAIRTQLKVYDGAIRWGGDYVNRADEMHFEINASAAKVAKVAAALKTPKPNTNTVWARVRADILAALNSADAKKVTTRRRKALLDVTRRTFNATKKY